MTQHTAAPWQENHWDGNQQITITAIAFRGPNVLALVRPPLTGIHIGTEDESWECTDRDVTEAGANARLIAAAPELLIAHERNANLNVDEIRREGRLADVLRNIIADARCVLLKAKGT